MATEAYDKLSRIDFNDGNPMGVAWNGWTLLLDYKNWQEQHVRLKFTGVAFVSGYGGSASLCRAVLSCDSPEIEQAKKKLAQDWGTSDIWKEKKLTQIVIIDDVPLLTVVFEDVDIQFWGEQSATIDSMFAEFDDRE